MSFPDGLFLSLRAATTKLLVLAALSLSVGCVTLDKPPQVAACSSKGTCSDEIVIEDAAAADQRRADEPVGRKEDVGPDGPSLSDSGPETGDASEVKQDASRPEATPDGPSGPDAGRDAVASPDGGAESGPDSLSDDVAKQDMADGIKDEDAPKDDVVDAAKDDGIADVPVKEDVAGPETPRDSVSTDVSYTACPAVSAVVGDKKIAFGTTGAVCFVTCDDIQYEWGCDGFTDAERQVKVNGTAIKCGALPLPAKVQPGDYYYFEVGPGGHTWDQIHWSGTAKSSCPAPAGGFKP